MEFFRTEIKDIGNYYGTLNIGEIPATGKCYYIIQDYDTVFSDLEEWTEIPGSLYDELMKHANELMEKPRTDFMKRMDLYWVKSYKFELKS